jgi:hypothetical protein
MNTILVWVLITVGGANSTQVTYSPPLADLESCQRVQKAAKELTGGERRGSYSQCVQIQVPK